MFNGGALRQIFLISEERNIPFSVCDDTRLFALNFSNNDSKGGGEVFSCVNR